MKYIHLVPFRETFGFFSSRSELLSLLRSCLLSFLCLSSSLCLWSCRRLSLCLSEDLSDFSDLTSLLSSALINSSCKTSVMQGLVLVFNSCSQDLGGLCLHRISLKIRLQIQKSVSMGSYENLLCYLVSVDI